MKAYQDEETGFMVLELDWYEAGVLANAARDLRKCSTGEYNDFYIGGACIQIKIIQGSKSDVTYPSGQLHLSSLIDLSTIPGGGAKWLKLIA